MTSQYLQDGFICFGKVAMLGRVVRIASCDSTLHLVDALQDSNHLTAGIKDGHTNHGLNIDIWEGLLPLLLGNNQIVFATEIEQGKRYMSHVTKRISTTV